MIEKIGNVEFNYTLKPDKCNDLKWSSKDNYLALSHFTSDVINWISIQSTDSILEIGVNRGEWIKSYLNARRVVAVEKSFNKAYKIAQRYRELSNLSVFVDEGNIHLNEKFDYIFIRDTLVGCDLNETIQQCKSLLNKGGQIIVLVKNPFALDTLANLNNDEIQYTRLSMSKKSLLKQLKSIELNSCFYYPYPNAIFPLKLFGDERLVSISDLTFDCRSIDRDIFQTFDVYKAYSEAINEEMFDVLSDSFLVVLGNDNQRNYSYIKISSERKTKYQISTLIKKDNISVVKKPLGEESLQHLKNMELFYQNKENIYLSDKVELCPCCMNSKSELEFDYVEGNNFNDLMNWYFAENDYGRIEKLIEEVFDIISHVANKDVFKITKPYLDLFGNTPFDGEYTAGDFSNVDMIMDNLIISDKIYIIDYEWNFSFPIPHQYILFRVLFFSIPFSQLKEEFKWSIYHKYGINEHDLDLFLSMEMKLQEYISGEEDKLTYYQDIFKSRLFNMDLFNIDKIVFDVTIDVIRNGERKTLYYQPAFLQEIDLILPLDIKENYTISIKPVNNMCYIKLDTLKLVDNESNELETKVTHNADLVIYDDYFFLQKPEIMIESNYASKLYLKYKVLKFNEDLIHSVVHLLVENQDLKNELSRYENKNAIQKLFMKK